MLFRKCIYILIAYHNKSGGGFYSKQWTNQFHSAKFDATSVLVPIKNAPVQILNIFIYTSFLAKTLQFEKIC